MVLHASHEADCGGNFSVVQTGDLITLNVAERSLNIHLTDEELQIRKQQFKPVPTTIERGYVNLYIQHVQQAHLGADMDFLQGMSGSDVSKDSH